MTTKYDTSMMEWKDLVNLVQNEYPNYSLREVLQIASKLRKNKKYKPGLKSSYKPRERYQRTLSKKPLVPKRQKPSSGKTIAQEKKNEKIEEINKFLKTGIASKIKSNIEDKAVKKYAYDVERDVKLRTGKAETSLSPSASYNYEAVNLEKLKKARNNIEKFYDKRGTMLELDEKKELDRLNDLINRSENQLIKYENNMDIHQQEAEEYEQPVYHNDVNESSEAEEQSYVEPSPYNSEDEDESNYPPPSPHHTASNRSAYYKKYQQEHRQQRSEIEKRSREKRRLQEQIDKQKELDEEYNALKEESARLIEQVKIQNEKKLDKGEGLKQYRNGHGIRRHHGYKDTEEYIDNDYEERLPEEYIDNDYEERLPEHGKGLRQHRAYNRSRRLPTNVIEKDLSREMYLQEQRNSDLSRNLFGKGLKNSRTIRRSAREITEPEFSQQDVQAIKADYKLRQDTIVNLEKEMTRLEGELATMQLNPKLNVMENTIYNQLADLYLTYREIYARISDQVINYSEFLKYAKSA